MFRFILLLLLERCWSSSIHSAHADDEALGPVMRRENLKAELAKSQEGGSTSTVQALNPLDPASLERPYRETVSIHLAARTTGSTTTSSTTSSTEGSSTSTTVNIEQLAEKAEEAAEAAAKASENAQWRARLSTVKDDEDTATETSETSETSEAEPATNTAAPFAATQAPTATASTAAGSSGSTISPQVEATSEATSEATTTQYSRKYITTSRRTMTIQVTTDTTSMGAARQSTLSPATSSIPLKIPAHMHPVLAPGSNFPEELSAASWQSLQARTSSTTSPAMPVEASVDAAAKVAQQAATKAGASEEDAAVAAAKAAAWMMKHQQSSRPTSHTSTTSRMSSTSSWVRYVRNVPSKADATQNQPGSTESAGGRIRRMENAYTAAAESVKNKYATSQIPFASNRSIKVMKEVNLTGRPMRVRVITRSDGDIVPTEAPEDEEETSTSEARDPAQLDEMGEMIDEVVLKDLPKIVAAVAAKICHRPFESEIPKAASRMVVKLLTQTPVKDVPEAILQMLMELAARERPSVKDHLPLVQSALQQILGDYRSPQKETISKVVDQAMDSAHDLEKTSEAEAEPQSAKVLRVITDAADRLAGSSDDSEDVDISTTQGEAEETAEASSASDSAESETAETETETEDSNSSNVTDGKAINSAEVLPDEDQPYTAAETMKSAKEHKGTARPQAASSSAARPIAVHSVHAPVHAPVKAVSPGSDKHAGDDDHDEEEELEVESPAKSGGKVLVGLTVFLGSLLMVVAITSAGYMAYQRSQERRQPADAAPAQASAASPAPAPAAASTQGSRASGASGASGAAPADAAPTFTGGPGGPEAGA